MRDKENIVGMQTKNKEGTKNKSSSELGNRSGLFVAVVLFVPGSQKRACRTGRDTQSFRMEAGQLTGVFKSESIQIPCLSFASVYLRT